MREITSAVDNHGGSGSHDNHSPEFENLRDQLHHRSMVLLACNLLVYYLNISFFFHFIIWPYHVIIDFFFVTILSCSSPFFFFWLPMQVEQPTEDMTRYMHYHDLTKIKNTMLDDDISQLINNDNLPEFSSHSDRLELFSLFLVFLILFSYHYCAVLCGKVISATFWPVIPHTFFAIL